MPLENIPNYIEESHSSMLRLSESARDNENRNSRKRKQPLPLVNAEDEVNASNDPSNKKRKRAEVEKERQKRLKRYFEAALSQLNIDPTVVNPLTLGRRKELQYLLVGKTSELKADTQGLSEALKEPLKLNGKTVFSPRETVLTVKDALSVFLKMKDDKAKTEQKCYTRRKSQVQVLQAAETLLNLRSFARGFSTGLIFAQLRMAGGNSQSCSVAENEALIAVGPAGLVPERGITPAEEEAAQVLHGDESGERAENLSVVESPRMRQSRTYGPK